MVARRLPVHALIPDTQIKPGVPTDHLRWIGRYLADSVQPDVIIHIGDHWDMPSLSSWDKGKRQYEGRRYEADIRAGNTAFQLLDDPIRRKRGYKPRKIIMLGNHEDRLQKMLDFDPFLYAENGVNGLSMKDFDTLDWEVYPFVGNLPPVMWVDGVAYAHYFYNPNTGRPYGGQASGRLKTIGHSFSMGHQQTLDYATRPIASPRGNTTQHGLVAGACYLHDEDYKGPQGNAHWRGIVICHAVENGSYNPMFIDLEYLCQRYEGMSVDQFISKNYVRPTNPYDEWLRK